MNGRPPINTDMLAQLRQLGAPADVIQATQQRLAAEAEHWHVDIWPDNWHAVQLFVALATQWHWVAGMAAVQRTGLRYEALQVPAVQALVDAQVAPPLRQPPAVLMRQLQVLEDTALAEWARQRTAAR